MTEYICNRVKVSDGVWSIERSETEIVRCRDCQYEDEPWNCAAPYHNEPDGFCKWGELRKDTQ